jgi:hypothetical protein
MRGENLHGHYAVEPRVHRFVHFTHTAGADGLQDFVRSQLFSGLNRHKRGQITSKGSREAIGEGKSARITQIAPINSRNWRNLRLFSSRSPPRPLLPAEKYLIGFRL